MHAFMVHDGLGVAGVAAEMIGGRVMGSSDKQS